MSGPTAIAEFQPAVVPNDVTTNGPREASLDSLLGKSWLGIALGIVAAGGAYPTIVAAAFSGFLILSAQVGVGELPSVGMLMITACFIGTLIGLVWTSGVVVVTLPVVYLFVRSLKLHGSIVWLGAICGGLVGFCAVLPFMLQALANENFEPWAALLLLVAGPGLATVVGQLGGAWGAWRTTRRRRWYEPAMSLPMVDASLEPDPRGPDGDGPTTPPLPPGIRFGIRHLLWIAVWLSLLLSVIRLSGVPFEFVLPLLAGWVFFQTLTLWIGRRLAALLEP
jgi:hypothetical protein